MGGRTRNHRLWVFIAATGVLLAACGGSDDASTETGALDASDANESATSDVAEVVADLEDTENVVDAAQDALEDMVDTEAGSASVTIDGETREFAIYPDMPVAVCDADFFGGFVAILTSDGDLSTPLNQMGLTLPGGDFQDPPTLTVNVAVGGEVEWIADETIYEQSPELPAGIGVTDFSIDGATASGTAMFYEQESYYQFTSNQTDELQMAEGSFEVNCGG